MSSCKATMARRSSFPHCVEEGPRPLLLSHWWHPDLAFTPAPLSPSHPRTHRSPANCRCPPCKAFTPLLVKTYKKLQAAGKRLEIVFVSSDRDMGQFKSYFATMPWLAIPPGDKRNGSSASYRGAGSRPSCWLTARPA